MLAQSISSPSVSTTLSTEALTPPEEDTVRLVGIPPPPPTVGATATADKFTTGSVIVEQQGPPQVVPVPVLALSSVPAKKSKPKKKPRKADPGALSSPQKLAVEENSNLCQIVIASVHSCAGQAPVPPTATAGNGSGRKRSRKQQISTLTDEVSLVSPPSTAKGSKAKRPKNSTPRSTSAGGRKKKNNIGAGSVVVVSENQSEKVAQSVQSSVTPSNNLSKRKVPQTLQKTSSVHFSNNLATASALLKKIKKNNAVDRELITIDDRPSSGPEEKIFLKSSELVDLKRFQVFHDSSRDLPAIGPSQVVIAVETLIEPGKQSDICKKSDSDNNNSFEFENSVLLDKYLTTPHYLPLSSVYYPGIPLSRILKFSSLLEFTGGVVQPNSSQTFRFRQGKELVNCGKSSLKGDGFLRNTIVIKYPILGRYSQKPVFLRFIVLKKIVIQGNTIGTLKGKQVKIQRTDDQKNIQIQLDDSSISEIPSDANAMSQRNVQPVIHKDSDLVPLLNRTTTGYLQHHQQQYQTVVPTSQQQYQQHQQHPHFQYISYRYQTANELELASSVPAALVTGNTVSFTEVPHNYNYVNQQAVNELHVPTEYGTDEHGNPLVIFCTNDLQTEPQSSINTGFLQAHQFNQFQEQLQVIQNQQGGSVYNSVPAQSQVIVQQQQQQTPTYFTVQPQSSQVPAQRYNELQHQLIPLDGGGYSLVNIPSTKNVSTLPVVNKQVPQQLQQGQVISLDGGGYGIVNITSPTNNVPSLPAAVNNQAQQQGQQVHLKTEPQNPNLISQNNHQVIVQPSAAQHHQLSQLNQRQVVIQTVQGRPGQFFQPSAGSTVTQKPENSLQQQRAPIIQQTPSIPQVQQNQQQQVTAHQPVQVQQQQQPKVRYQSVIQKPIPHHTYPAQLPTQHHQPVSSYNSPASQHQTTIPINVIQNLYQQQVQAQARAPTAPSTVVDTLASTLKPKKAKAKKEGKGKNSNQDNVCIPSGGLQENPQFPISTSSTTPVIQSAKGSSGPSIAHIVRESTLPQTVGQELAGNLHSSSTVVPRVEEFSSPSPKKKIIIVQHKKDFGTSSSATSSSSTVTSAQVIDTRPARKAGFLAVCPHCGYSTENILRCSRCKAEFPETVKLIRDQWSVNTSEVSVAAVVPKTTVPSTPSVTESAVKTNNTLKTPNTVRKGPAQKKIVVVNKPAILNSTNKTLVTTTGSSVVVTQLPDGGSTVAIITKGGVKPAAAIKPPARKRPAPRKKVQECITLSSDEEEPEPPKPKIVKVEGSESAKNSENTSIPIPSVVESSGAVSQAPVLNKEHEKQSLASEPGAEQNLAPETPETSDMARRKMAINLLSSAPDEAEMPQEKEPEETPEQVLEKIESQQNEPGSNFEFATIKCRSIRVGSYKMTNADIPHLTVTLTSLGITFALPLANSKSTVMKRKSVCIPKENVLSIQANMTKKLPVLFIKTGIKYAGWLRTALGMDGSPENKHSNYYCPMKGNSSQRAITVLAEVFPDADIGLIRKMYADTLQEIDYDDANKYLMDITPESFRSSINYQPDPNSPAAKSTNLADTSRLNASTDNLQTKSTASLGTAPITGGSLQDVDSEATILYYEGNKAKIPISPKDITCLGYSQFLNDQIIDFWLSVIHTELLSEEDRKRTFVFDSFFYSKLTEKKKKTAEDGTLNASERRHARVKKRTKNVDIFEKDFLIVPINENYHWFIVIICFPGMQGYHDYDTLEPLPEYGNKKLKLTSATPNAKKSKPKPIVSKQPQNDSTASYTDRDEAPEDPEEANEINNASSEDSQPSPPATDTVTPATETDKKGATGIKRKLETSGRKVKHPSIILFDSLAGDCRGRIYSTLRDYLRVEYKTKRNMERVFDKNTMPGFMPKVPQQPNFSDCGLFMLQYIESFFSDPLPTYDQKAINLRTWFESMIAENKRREIYDFIKRKIELNCPENLSRVPEVNFEPDGTECDMDDPMNLYGCRDSTTDDPDYDDEEDEDDELFEKVKVEVKNKKTNNAKTESTPQAAAGSPNHTQAHTKPTATTTSLTTFRTSPAKPRSSTSGNTIIVTLMPAMKTPGSSK